MTTASDLFQSNPWWMDRKTIEKDRSILEWEKSELRWIPQLGKTFQWGLDVIYVLRGPRQVGKTTLCKLKMREFLSKGVAPKRLFYWACDLVDKPEKLVEIVDSYLDFSREAKGRRYLFLDEISSVVDWQKGIKFLYDRGRLKYCTVVLTGSHSIDLRKASETLAGRRGDVHKLKDKLPDKILLPMKFAEYVRARSSEAAKLLEELSNQKRFELLSKIGTGKIPNEIEEASLLLKEINQLYFEYLLTGGIPRAINEFISSGAITKDIYELYVELLLKDVRKWGGNDSLMRQIVRKLDAGLGSRASLHSLQQDTEISSHHTVSSYLDYLKDSFALNIIYKLDRSRNEPIYRGDKKIYFQDPFIFHALRSWYLGTVDSYEESLHYLKSEENLGKLTECVVANHLVRLLFTYFPSNQFDYSNLLFYSESKKKRELDFVMRQPRKQRGFYLPIEVKYQSGIRKENGFAIFDFQKGGKASPGLLLTKDSLKSHGSYMELPASLFLLLI